MGFSSSYNEAMLVESSAIVRGGGTPQIENKAFIQFVYDNADVNVNTLDGENTFHEIRGIMVVTPRNAVLPDTPRLKKNISAEQISSHAILEIQRCSWRKNAGLSKITIVEVDEDFKIADGNKIYYLLHLSCCGCWGKPLTLLVSQDGMGTWKK